MNENNNLPAVVNGGFTIGGEDFPQEKRISFKK